MFVFGATELHAATFDKVAGGQNDEIAFVPEFLGGECPSMFYRDKFSESSRLPCFSHSKDPNFS